MNFVESLKKDLKNEYMPSSALLSKFRVVDEGIRKTNTYLDSNYFPFYYHLGKYILCQNMVEIGLGLGFFSYCFLNSCKTVKNFVALTPQINAVTLKNIRTVYSENFETHIGKITDRAFEDKLKKHKWDLFFINDEVNYDIHLAYLSFAWQNLELDGYLVMDHVQSHPPAQEAYLNFCKIQRKDPVIFSTRYGTGLIQK